jgi:hypothetical protein
VKSKIEGLAEGKEYALTMANVHSNSTWAGGEFMPHGRKPFVVIAVSNSDHQRKKATFQKKCGLLLDGVPYRI